MRELITTDDLANAVGWFVGAKPKNTIRDTHNKARFKGKGRYHNYLIVSDNNGIGKQAYSLLLAASERKSTKIETVSAVNINGSFNDPPAPPEETELVTNIYTADELPELNDQACFIIINSTNLAEREKTLDAADKALAALAKGHDNRCVFCVVLPEFPTIPGDVERLAEREYSYFIEEYIKDKTPAQQYYLEIEALCRKYVLQGFTNVSFLRTANVFGPEAYETVDFDLVSIVNEIFDTHTVKLTEEDFRERYSCAYVTEVLYAMFHISYNGDKGHMYQYAGFRASVGDLKYSIYKTFQQQLRLTADVPVLEKLNYHCIDNLKYRKTRPKKHMELVVALKRFCCYERDLPYELKQATDIYAGKFNRLKDLEMEILREIDRICKENDIDYFLAGGSMLGAVRYNKNIPWDDDIDVAFVREEFDKFREACDRDLNPKFIHSCWYNESESHYPIDKIRYRETFFSTNYSALNNVPDGVFVDLLVHDNTSKNDFIAQMHCNVVAVLRKILEKIWQNLRPDQIRHRSIRLIYPLMKKIPINFYQILVEKSLILYKNRKDYGRVIDSTGKIIRRGPMPGAEMHKTKRIPFEGDFMAPIPEDPVPYLTHVYGPDYIQEPRLSKRQIPHKFSRIDLGEFVFENDKEPSFRKVDLRGELFEQ